jgi:polyferredoxin
MSEFERLMREGSRKSKKRQAKRHSTRKTLLWALGISFLWMIFLPWIGGPIFLFLTLLALIYANREWMG